MKSHDNMFLFHFKSRLHRQFILTEQQGRALLLLCFFPHLTRLHMKLPTVIQGSLPRSPYTIQIKLVKKENNDKQKGMNSTLLVLTTCFCNCGIAKRLNNQIMCQKMKKSIKCIIINYFLLVFSLSILMHFYVVIQYMGSIYRVVAYLMELILVSYILSILDQYA